MTCGNDLHKSYYTIFFVWYIPFTLFVCQNGAGLSKKIIDYIDYRHSNEATI